MNGLRGEIVRLFAAPGRPGAMQILRRAAAAHHDLLLAALADVGPRYCPSLTALTRALPSEAFVRRRFLCDPVLIEGLHELATCCAAVRDWHQCTADATAAGRHEPCNSAGTATAGPLLGNAALAALLRADPQWCGTLQLRTDCFGLVRFPLSDWCLSLTTAGDGACLLSDERIAVRLARGAARFSLGCDGARPILSMPRGLLVRMLVHDDETPESRGMLALDPVLRSRWQRAAPLCPGGARFLPVHCTAGESHAARCGGVVRSLHDELHDSSPAVHREFCRLIQCVHGFQLMGGVSSGVVQSFSEPQRPRLMGYNVPFSDGGDPQACPFSVTSLGHEMAHTKMYLASSIGWRESWRFLNNAGERTGFIRRYGRALSVRTLFQIPYTHLYEWTILMGACEAGLPGYDPSSTAPERFGDDLRDEIIEAFDSIDALAELTPHGRVALEHFRRLFDTVDARWRRLNRSRLGLMTGPPRNG